MSSREVTGAPLIGKKNPAFRFSAARIGKDEDVSCFADETEMEPGPRQGVCDVLYDRSLDGLTAGAAQTATQGRVRKMFLLVFFSLFLL